MKLPVNEDDDEEMVRVPKALEVDPSPLLGREPDERRETNRHDPTRDAWSRHEIDLQESDNLPSEVG